jgi:hypothetical protein
VRVHKEQSRFGAARCCAVLRASPALVLSTRAERAESRRRTTNAGTASGGTLARASLERTPPLSCLCVLSLLLVCAPPLLPFPVPLSARLLLPLPRLEDAADWAPTHRAAKAGTGSLTTGRGGQRGRRDESALVRSGACSLHLLCSNGRLPSALAGWTGLDWLALPKDLTDRTGQTRLEQGNTERHATERQRGVIEYTDAALPRASCRVGVLDVG